VRLWARDDATIASGEEQRTWTWGPLVLNETVEPYAQAPSGQRQVWYLDKGRMEITHPEADTDDDWFVTSGLLVRELISGQMQLGDEQFEFWQPAEVPVAGDMEAVPEQTITFAVLRPYASIDGEGRAPERDKAVPIVDLINPGGALTTDEHLATYNVRAGAYDEVLGHNIAHVFLDAIPAETMLYIAGRPLTEPFWARVPINRERRDVLIQAFERRVLTYTPNNPDGWQVEWGNAGRQYAQWRYGALDLSASFEPSSVMSMNGSIRQLRELSPEAANVARDRKGLVGVAVYQLSTGDVHSFQGTRAFPMYSTAKVPIMLTVLDRAVREQRRVTASEQALIEAMIQVSDNNAATTLITSVGGADAVERYLRRIGIANTHMNGYAWGASTTTAQDMARLMAKLGNCSILVPRLCRYALQTMQNVVRSQKWGVSAGVPDPGSVALKNGWYPQRAGWGVNSLGLVTSEGKQYAIAVYTNPDPSMRYGIDTIEQISAAIFPAIP
jgi:beta-lactamase class A